MLGMNEPLNGVGFSWRNSHLKRPTPLIQVNPPWNPFSTPWVFPDLQQFGIHEFHTIPEHLEERTRCSSLTSMGCSQISPPPPLPPAPSRFSRGKPETWRFAALSWEPPNPGIWDAWKCSILTLWNFFNADYNLQGVPGKDKNCGNRILPEFQKSQFWIFFSLLNPPFFGNCWEQVLGQNLTLCSRKKNLKL